MASFGEGLGAVIGGAMADDHLAEGLSNVGRTAGNFNSSTAPFRSFGQSFLDQATVSANAIEGRARDSDLSYDTFMKNYEASPGSKYLIGQAEEAQNNSAAARGKLLSGGNLRGLETLRTGLSNTFANQAYGQYLAGEGQEFGQLETSLGNMFKAIGVGTTATGQEAGVASSQMGAQASLAAEQAKNDRSKGSGLGSMFGGLGSIATMF
jgi:hypothetical protein